MSGMRYRYSWRSRLRAANSIGSQCVSKKELDWAEHSDHDSFNVPSPRSLMPVLCKCFKSS